MNSCAPDHADMVIQSIEPHPESKHNNIKGFQGKKKSTAVSMFIKLLDY